MKIKPEYQYAETIKRLETAIRQSGLSKKEFAVRCGVTSQTVNKWLHPEYEDVYLEARRLPIVGDVLNVSLDWLLGGKLQVLRHSPQETFRDQVVTLPLCTVAPLSTGGKSREAVSLDCKDRCGAVKPIAWFEEHDADREGCKVVRIGDNAMAPLIRERDTVIVDCSTPAATQIRSGCVYLLTTCSGPSCRRVIQQLNGDLVLETAEGPGSRECVKADKLGKLVAVVGRVIERSGII